MGDLETGQFWTILLAVASAIVLLSNAVEKIVKVVRAAKAPNDMQNGRLDDLEKWQKSVEERLRNDYQRLEKMDEGNRAIQRAILALLDHGIDGNNLDQMQKAKDLLQSHLINR